jgi:tRNA pseudouridine55 synthase
MGTLDPIADGVLPIAVGKAARLFGYLTENKRKEYVAEFKFGYLTDTLDITGVLTADGGKIPDANEINAVLREFTGELLQLPPAFSAKKVGGVRAYTLARAGESPVLAAKSVTVYSFLLEAAVDADTFRFRIACSGGTYIRSLARDLGARLGTYAVMSALTRVSTGYFHIKDSISVGDIAPDKLITVDAAVNLPRYDVPDVWRQRFGCGVKIPAEFDGERLIYCGNELYGLGSTPEGKLIMSAYLKDENN